MKTVKLSKLKQYGGNPRIGNVDLIACCKNSARGGSSLNFIFPATS